MSLKEALTELAESAAWEIERARRNYAKLNMKMEIFVAGFNGKVYDPEIRIYSHSSDIPKHPNPKRFVCCYVRTKGKSSTFFNWFHHMDSANYFADLAKKSGKIVVGPYELPWGENDRFL